MSYYKTNDPVVLAVIEEQKRQLDELRAAGKAFADKWGGTPFYARSITNIRFTGVRFLLKKDPLIWTKPDPNDGTQRPRASAVKGASAEAKAELLRIKAEWAAEFPQTGVDLDGLYQAIGSSWGELFFQGISYFEGNDGYFYVETGAKLPSHMEEILGSEFSLAKAEITKKEQA